MHQPLHSRSLLTGSLTLFPWLCVTVLKESMEVDINEVTKIARGIKNKVEALDRSVRRVLVGIRVLEGHCDRHFPFGYQNAGQRSRT